MTRAIPGLLAGRKVLVTGGANGIGAAVTRRFELMRAQVVVLDRPDARPANATVRAVSADVRDEGQLSSAVTEAVALLGGLDTVIAAAGVVPAWQAITALDLDEFDRVMAINARGVAATIKHTAPHLGVGSTITAVASINAWQAAATMTSYVASKHAVLGVVRAAALALGPAGVRVNAGSARTGGHVGPVVADGGPRAGVGSERRAGTGRGRRGHRARPAGVGRGGGRLSGLPELGVVLGHHWADDQCGRGRSVSSVGPGRSACPI